MRPVDNPLVPARVELGRLLFFDPILSGPRDVACSTCHLPRFNFTDARQFPSGAGATGLGPDRTQPAPLPLREMPRNSPPVLNAGLYGRGDTRPSTNGTMFWSGAAFGIEDQVLNPIGSDKELRGLTYPRAVALDSVLARLRAIQEYRVRFADAFPEVAALAGGSGEALVTPTTLRLALAAYLRELTTPDAPLDRFLEGDEAALTPIQREGLALFIGDAGCVSCHTGPLLSDFSMHVVGGAQAGLGRDTTPGDDLGWGEHGGTPYSFRTPPLRQVAETAPYLHAGTAATLRQVLEFKNRGRSEHPRIPDAALSPLVRPLGLTDGELDALEAFLGALTDPLEDAGELFDAPLAVPSGLEVPR
ncbi:MAG: cytochrome c peroxidase [Gemmatimonadota bacterium]